MSEEKKRQPKTIHVDTLHIKANEIVIHQEPQENSQDAPQAQAQNFQGEPMQIQRDFWGFPIPQFQQQEEPQAEESTEEETTEEENNA